MKEEGEAGLTIHHSTQQQEKDREKGVEEEEEVRLSGNNPDTESVAVEEDTASGIEMSMAIMTWKKKEDWAILLVHINIVFYALFFWLNQPVLPYLVSIGLVMLFNY